MVLNRFTLIAIRWVSGNLEELAHLLMENKFLIYNAKYEKFGFDNRQKISHIRSFLKIAFLNKIMWKIQREN